MFVSNKRMRLLEARVDRLNGEVRKLWRAFRQLENREEEKSASAAAEAEKLFMQGLANIMSFKG